MEDVGNEKRWGACVRGESQEEKGRLCNHSAERGICFSLICISKTEVNISFVNILLINSSFKYV